MKPSTHKVNGHQPKKGSPTFLKKKTNIRWNSAIFFQVGLIIALLASVFAMDLKISEKQTDVVNEQVLNLHNDFFDTYTLEEPPQKVEEKPIAKKQATPEPVTKLIDEVKKVENNSKEVETKIAAPSTEVVTEKPIKENPTTTEKPVKKATNYANSVEFAPVFPGCESLSNNQERIQCLSDKIAKFVSRKFNTNVADATTQGKQRINVKFTIDKNGYVTDIIAQAKDSSLEKEAQRVLSKLPKFQPGMQGVTKVDVLYMLPIVFKIQ